MTLRQGGRAAKSIIQDPSTFALDQRATTLAPVGLLYPDEDADAVGNQPDQAGRMSAQETADKPAVNVRTIPTFDRHPWFPAVPEIPGATGR